MMQRIKLHLRTVGLTGLLCAIGAKVTNSMVRFTVDREDCRHPLRLRLHSSDVQAYDQVFVGQEYDFVVEAQPKVIVDAGANIGLASIYFANRYPTARIIALEPEQSNFELLKDNVRAYPQVIPVQAALWNNNDEINLIDPGLGKWGFMTETKDAAQDRAVNTCHTVAALTIDRIMKDYDLAKIDILKIDIEGAEKEVFSDTSAWIGRVDAIVIELHDRMKPGCSDSFYSGAVGFDHHWFQGENVFLSRGNCVARRPA
jgi:FkbM family methyltransferase